VTNDTIGENEMPTFSTTGQSGMDRYVNMLRQRNAERAMAESVAANTATANRQVLGNQPQQSQQQQSLAQNGRPTSNPTGQEIISTDSSGRKTRIRNGVHEWFDEDKGYWRNYTGYMNPKRTQINMAGTSAYPAYNPATNSQSRSAKTPFGLSRQGIRLRNQVSQMRDDYENHQRWLAEMERIKTPPHSGTITLPDGRTWRGI
jgi:hypothetical protein